MTESVPDEIVQLVRETASGASETEIEEILAAYPALRGLVDTLASSPEAEA